MLLNDIAERNKDVVMGKSQGKMNKFDIKKTINDTNNAI